MKRALSLLFVCLLAAGSTLPRRGFQLERRLPQSTLLFVHTPSGKEARASFEKTAVSELFRDPEIKAFLAPALRTMEKQFEEWKGELEKELGMTFDEAVDLIDGQVAVAVLGLAEEEGEAAVRIVATIEAPGKAKQLAKVLDCAKRHFEKIGEGETKSYKVKGIEVVSGLISEQLGWHLALEGDTLIGATDRGSMETVLRGGPKAPLADAEAFQLARKKVSAAGSEAMFLFLNGRPAVDALRKQMDPESAQMLDALGLDAWTSLAVSVTFGAPAIRERLFVGLEGERRGLARLLSLKEDAPGLENAPEGVLTFTSLRIDLAELYQTFFEVVRSVDEVEAGRIEDELARIENETGISIEEDLLPALGDRMYGHLAMPKVGLLPDAVTAYEIADEKKFDKCLKAALKNLEAKVGEIPFEGKTINYIDFDYGEFEEYRMFLSNLYWYRDGNRLFVTGIGSLLSMSGVGSPNALKRMILAKKRGSVAEREPLKTWLAEGGRPAAVFYVDFEKGFNLVYNSLAPFLSFFGPAIGELGFDVPSLRLPMGETIGKALGKSLIRAHVEKEGLRIEAVSRSGLTTMTVAYGGALAAMILPAIQQAMMGAKTSACANNMRMVYYGAWRYMAEQGESKWPAETGEEFLRLLEKEGYIEEGGATCPHSGLSFRGPAKDANKLTDEDILLCDDPGSHPDGSINALYKSGMIVTIRPDEPEYKKALEATRKK